MEKGKPSNIARRLLLVFMTVAFFYLVIGDLIIIHQRAIFDFDIFTCYPISKSDKASKKNLNKLKSKDPNFHVSFLTFFSGSLELKDNGLYQSKILIGTPSISEFIIENHSLLRCLRGPPLLA